VDVSVGVRLDVAVREGRTVEVVALGRAVNVPVGDSVRVGVGLGPGVLGVHVAVGGCVPVIKGVGVLVFVAVAVRVGDSVCPAVGVTLGTGVSVAVRIDWAPIRTM